MKWLKTWIFKVKMAIKWKEKLEVKEPVNLDNEDIQRTSIILHEMWFRRKPGAWTNYFCIDGLKNLQ